MLHSLDIGVGIFYPEMGCIGGVLGSTVTELPFCYLGCNIMFIFGYCLRDICRADLLEGNVFKVLKVPL